MRKVSNVLACAGLVVAMSASSAGAQEITLRAVTAFAEKTTYSRGFERFIEWTSREQAAGRYVCFGIVPRGCDQVVGIIQVRQLDPTFATAEWGLQVRQAHGEVGGLQTSVDLDDLARDPRASV